jgi:hypothetical protein
VSSLSDRDVSDKAAVVALISRFQTKYDSVRSAYGRRVLAKIPTELARREDARRREEKERLARLEQERLKKLDEERLAREISEKKAAEEAKAAAERKALEAELTAREERRKRSFNGFGQEATRDFSLWEGLAIVRLKHRGTANFIVSLLNESGDTVVSLANVIGSCTSSRAVRIP